MITETNYQIQKIGIKYIGHYNCSRVLLYGRNFSVEIPLKRMREFTNIFPDVQWEDGRFLEDLKGRYIRVVIDDKTSNIVAIKHITDDLVFEISE
jgi:hypothetical protein